LNENPSAAGEAAEEILATFARKIKMDFASIAKFVFRKFV